VFFENVSSIHNPTKFLSNYVLLSVSTPPQPIHLEVHSPMRSVIGQNDSIRLLIGCMESDDRLSDLSVVSSASTALSYSSSNKAEKDKSQKASCDTSPDKLLAPSSPRSREDELFPCASIPLKSCHHTVEKCLHISSVSKWTVVQPNEHVIDQINTDNILTSRSVESDQSIVHCVVSSENQFLNISELGFYTGPSHVLINVPYTSSTVFDAIESTNEILNNEEQIESLQDHDIKEKVLVNSYNNNNIEDINKKIKTNVSQFHINFMIKGTLLRKDCFIYFNVSVQTTLMILEKPFILYSYPTSLHLLYKNEKKSIKTFHNQIIIRNISSVTWNLCGISFNDQTLPGLNLLSVMGLDVIDNDKSDLNEVVSIRSKEEYCLIVELSVEEDTLNLLKAYEGKQTDREGHDTSHTCNREIGFIPQIKFRMLRDDSSCLIAVSVHSTSQEDITQEKIITLNNINKNETRYNKIQQESITYFNSSYFYIDCPIKIPLKQELDLQSLLHAQVSGSIVEAFKTENNTKDFSSDRKIKTPIKPLYKIGTLLNCQYKLSLHRTCNWSDDHITTGLNLCISVKETENWAVLGCVQKSVHFTEMHSDIVIKLQILPLVCGIQRIPPILIHLQDSSLLADMSQSSLLSSVMTVYPEYHVHICSQGTVVSDTYFVD